MRSFFVGNVGIERFFFVGNVGFLLLKFVGNVNFDYLCKAKPHKIRFLWKTECSKEKSIPSC